MLSKTKLQKIERYWRRFVFGSRFTQIYFWSGMALFVVAIFTPRETRVVLMERGFCSWFGLMLFYLASTYLLTMLVAFLRRDWIGGVWLAALTLGFILIGCAVLRFVFR